MNLRWLVLGFATVACSDGQRLAFIEPDASDEASVAPGISYAPPPFVPTLHARADASARPSVCGSSVALEVSGILSAVVTITNRGADTVAAGVSADVITLDTGAVVGTVTSTRALAVGEAERLPITLPGEPCGEALHNYGFVARVAGISGAELCETGADFSAPAWVYCIVPP